MIKSDAAGTDVVQVKITITKDMYNRLAAVGKAKELTAAVMGRVFIAEGVTRAEQYVLKLQQQGQK